VPEDHPLRAIRLLVNAALDRLSPAFASIYADTGRPSIPPEKLLRALLLQALFTIRSERQLMQQITYNMLFRWFVGLAMDVPVPKDGSGEPPAPGRNGERDVHGEKRSNETHASTTDPDARLFRKATGQSSKLCHMAHVLIENRNGLVVDATTTTASGTAERSGDWSRRFLAAPASGWVGTSLRPWASSPRWVAGA